MAALFGHGRTESKSIGTEFERSATAQTQLERNITDSIYRRDRYMELRRWFRCNTEDNIELGGERMLLLASTHAPFDVFSSGSLRKLLFLTP